MAYQDGVITLQAKIRVRMVKGEESQLIETTCGRLIFNDPIPQDLGFVDRSIPENKFKLEIEFKVGKKELGKIIDRCIRVHGTARTCEVLDRIKAQGYKYSTKGAITVAVSDATIPPEKKQLVADAEKAALSINRQYESGLLSEQERKDRVIRIWNDTTNAVAEAQTAAMDEFNPIFMMADSGARTLR